MSTVFNVGGQFTPAPVEIVWFRGRDTRMRFVPETANIVFAYGSPGSISVTVPYQAEYRDLLDFVLWDYLTHVFGGTRRVYVVREVGLELVDGRPVLRIFATDELSVVWGLGVGYRTGMKASTNDLMDAVDYLLRFSFQHAYRDHIRMKAGVSASGAFRFNQLPYASRLGEVLPFILGTAHVLRASCSLSQWSSTHVPYVDLAVERIPTVVSRRWSVESGEITGFSYVKKGPQVGLIRFVKSMERLEGAEIAPYSAMVGVSPSSQNTWHSRDWLGAVPSSREPLREVRGKVSPAKAVCVELASVLEYGDSALGVREGNRVSVDLGNGVIFEDIVKRVEVSLSPEGLTVLPVLGAPLEVDRGDDSVMAQLEDKIEFLTRR